MIDITTTLMKMVLEQLNLKAAVTVDYSVKW